MKHFRGSRTTAGAVAGLTLLSGLGLGLATAAPAAAYAGYCNDSYASAYTTFNCITGEGASGSHVKAIQNALRHCHKRTKVEVDGHFGPITEAELMKVQAALGLKDDGMYGPDTRDKLKWRSSSGHCATLP